MGIVSFIINNPEIKPVAPKPFPCYARYNRPKPPEPYVTPLLWYQLIRCQDDTLAPMHRKDNNSITYAILLWTASYVVTNSRVVAQNPMEAEQMFHCHRAAPCLGM